MKLLHKNGVTSVILRVKLLDSASLVGAGKTGLTSASAGLIISTIASNEAAATSYTAAGNTIEAVGTLGTFAPPTDTKCRFKEANATNHPGLYELQIADARFAVAGARHLIVSIQATGVVQCDVEIELTSLDLFDAVRGGLTALPNVASGSAGAIPTTGTGANQIAVNGAGAISSVVSVAACQDLLEADRVIDTTVVPWALVLIKKGSGTLGQPGTVELLRQKLRDVHGASITNVNTILGQSVT